MNVDVPCKLNEDQQRSVNRKETCFWFLIFNCFSGCPETNCRDVLRGGRRDLELLATHARTACCAQSGHLQSPSFSMSCSLG